jgi:hypothetical protein
VEEVGGESARRRASLSATFSFHASIAFGFSSLEGSRICDEEAAGKGDKGKFGLVGR